MPSWPPREPPASVWDLSLERAEAGEDLIAIGADLEPGTLLDAYRSGIFPMGLGPEGHGPMGWWSPDPRGVLLPGALRTSRSLRASARRYRVSVDRAFSEVVAGCADPARRGRWITTTVAEAYGRLHELGWAHSIEVWQDTADNQYGVVAETPPGEDAASAGSDVAQHEPQAPAGGRLVGGLYGVAIGGLFAGESMFHRARDASKVALVALVERFFDDDPRRLVDVQWCTPHLASLGVVEWPRDRYLDALSVALEAPDQRFS